MKKAKTKPSRFVLMKALFLNVQEPQLVAIRTNISPGHFNQALARGLQILHHSGRSQMARNTDVGDAAKGRER